MLLLYILWDDWPSFMFSHSNEHLQQQLEYTLLKPDCHSWWISKMQSGRQDILEERYAIKFCFKLGKNASERRECFRLLFDHLAWIEHQFLSSIRDSRKARSLWRMMRRVGGVRKSIDQSWLAKGLGLGLGLLCWGFKGVQKEMPSEEASILYKSGQWHFHQKMHQSTTPSLSQTIWPRWALRQFLGLPIIQALLPVTFGYSLSSQAVVRRQFCWWKRLWRRSLTHSHKTTSMGSFQKLLEQYNKCIAAGRDYFEWD